VAQREGKVLVEEVLKKLAHAEVRPAAVHEEKTLEKTELGEGVVAGEDSLHAFLARDAHTDVGSCNMEVTYTHWS